MNTAPSPPDSRTPEASLSSARAAVSRLLRGAIEAVVLVLVVLAPWAFGCVYPLPQLGLAVGLAVLLALWGARILVEGGVAWVRCPVTLLLVGLFLLGVWQITPLPPALLGWLSPATASLTRELLPREPESITAGAEEAALRAGSTLSLYPGGTRAALVGVLAAVVLFAVVRNNVASPASLRRLAVAAVLNGTLLSLVGLAQRLSCPPNLIYWHFPAAGQVFGPFGNRNHFACYVNVCVGLGLGLLLARGASGPEGRTPAGPLRRLLQDPAALWLSAALALMLSASVFCLSRGGLLGLLAGGVVCVALAARRSPELRGLAAVLVAAVLALGLVGWFGFGAVESRLATLWKGDALRDERLALWGRTFPFTAQFPIWGTGFGTFSYVEPLGRRERVQIEFVYDHAHNDYLEVLIEGGVVGLALVVAAVTVVFRRGARAYLRPRVSGVRGLALGALFGLAAAAIHSVVDFNLRIAAVAVLALVVAAQLVGQRDGARDATPGFVRAWGVAPLAGVLAMVVLAWALLDACWRTHQAERYRLAAARCAASADLGARSRELGYRHAAAALAPENVERQLELADALYERYLSGGPDAESEFLVPALRRYAQARALNPLPDRPHVRLAAHADRAGAREGAAAYLARARRVLPADDRVWYLSGLQALRDGRHDEAWGLFRRSLLLSDRHVAGVIAAASPMLGPAELAERVLPEDATLLVRAGELPEAPGSRRELFARALAILDRSPQPPSVEGLHARARAHRALGDTKDALRAYRQLLDRAPGRVAWRSEYAELLSEDGRLAEARRELLTVLGDDPGNTAARDLYQEIVGRMAAGE